MRGRGMPPVRVLKAKKATHVKQQQQMEDEPLLESPDEKPQLPRKSVQTAQIYTLLWINFGLFVLLTIFVAAHVMLASSAVVTTSVVAAKEQQQVKTKQLPFNIVSDAWFNLSLKLESNVAHYDVCCRTMTRLYQCNNGKVLEVSITINDDVRLHALRQDMIGATCVFSYTTD